MKNQDTLLKLRRAYSNDEVISALYKRIESISIELGKVISERDEAFHLTIEQKQKKHNSILLKDYKKRYHIVSKENKRLTNTNKELILKILTLNK